MTIGIDNASVAGNQPPDWRLARKAGVQFAILRASYAGYSSAKKTWTPLPDKHFARDWAKTPVVKGAYMFPEPRSTYTPEQQVAVFAKSIADQGGFERGVNLPPVLDIEFPGGLQGKSIKAARRAAVEWMLRAAEAMWDTFDVAPMLYTSARVWDGEDPDALDADTLTDLVGKLKECPLWLARYPFKYRIKAVTNPPDGGPPVPKMWGANDWWIWQYQGDAIQLPGFTSNVDMNKFNTMRKGEKGERVKWVQGKLGITKDGIFGPNTERSLIKFQKDHKLGVDGVIGIKTFAALAWV